MPIEVLLCYRGRFSNYISELLKQLRTLGIRVTYDSEILSRETSFGPATVVDWFTVGESTQDATAWRAPLKDAVQSAELVVFAIEISDMSENVLNEIRWAILHEVNAFFLLHGTSTDATRESAGVIVGTLAGFYMMTTGNPQYPEFGFHFFEEDEDTECEADAIVAANRITAHLARVRMGPLKQLSGDNDAKLSDIEKRPDRRGRRHLQQIQEKIQRVYVPDVKAAPVLDDAVTLRAFAGAGNDSSGTIGPTD